MKSYTATVSNQTKKKIKFMNTKMDPFTAVSNLLQNEIKTAIKETKTTRPKESGDTWKN